ncbi:hypothetical protein Cadr_000011941 [Camelus dromedarius]|uniref:Secreted protein n=1 Tax=Camelus dromedarius TaxID=9838 RepID=A0A5N4DS98_CAMDR|nr:hypothetical protein Cadr_000011941 [Camelus dromedarius]
MFPRLPGGACGHPWSLPVCVCVCVCVSVSQESDFAHWPCSFLPPSPPLPPPPPPPPRFPSFPMSPFYHLVFGLVLPQASFSREPGGDQGE